MDTFIEIVRIVLAAVFIVSGVAKLLDRDGSAAAMRGFGVPERLVPVGAAALPWVELALAVGLLIAPVTGWAAFMATGLFAIFTVAVVRIVVRKEELECHCFGQLDRAPVSGRTVMRNVALTIGAALVWWHAVARGATAIWAHIVWPYVFAVALIVILAGMLWVLYQILLTLVEMQTLAAQSPTSVSAPDSTTASADQSFAQITKGMKLIDTNERVVSLPLMHSRRSATMLVFVTATCSACCSMMPDLAKWQDEFAGTVRIVPIGFGDREKLTEMARTAGLEQMFFQHEGDAARAFRFNGVPAGVLVDRDGFVRQQVAAGPGSIRATLEAVAQATSAS